MARPDSKVEIEFSRDAKRLLERVAKGIEALDQDRTTNYVMSFGSSVPIDSHTLPHGPDTYVSKKVVIQAVQFDGNNVDEIRIFTGRDSIEGEIKDVFTPRTIQDGDTAEFLWAVWDKLHETWVGVRLGQWIIKGMKGEFYPCDDEVFKSKYQPWTVDDYEPEEELYYGEDTLFKVRSALTQEGISEHITDDVIRAILNAGIKFREVRD